VTQACYLWSPSGTGARTQSKNESSMVTAQARDVLRLLVCSYVALGASFVHAPASARAKALLVAGLTPHEQGEATPQHIHRLAVYHTPPSDAGTPSSSAACSQEAQRSMLCLNPGDASRAGIGRPGALVCRRCGAFRCCVLCWGGGGVGGGKLVF